MSLAEQSEDAVIKSWWGQIFDEEYDSFKFDHMAIGVLNEIRENNLIGDQCVREKLVHVFVQQERSYRDRGDKLQEMEKSAIPKKLHSLVQQDIALKTLSKVAAQLSTDSGNQRQFVNEVSRIKLKNVLDKEIECPNKSVAELKHLAQRASRLEKNKALVDLNPVNTMEKQIGFTKYMIAKSGQYCNAIKGIEDDIATRKDASIVIETLMDKYQLLSNMKSKLKSANMQLDGYCSLPPNQYLARLKTAEAQQELVSSFTNNLKFIFIFNL